MMRVYSNKEEKYTKELLRKYYGTHSMRVGLQRSWRTQRYHTNEKQDLGKEVKASKIGIKTWRNPAEPTPLLTENGPCSLHPNDILYGEMYQARVWGWILGEEGLSDAIYMKEEFTVENMK